MFYVRPFCWHSECSRCWSQFCSNRSTCWCFSAAKNSNKNLDIVNANSSIDVTEMPMQRREQWATDELCRVHVANALKRFARHQNDTIWIRECKSRKTIETIQLHNHKSSNCISSEAATKNYIKKCTETIVRAPTDRPSSVPVPQSHATAETRRCSWHAFASNAIARSVTSLRGYLDTWFSVWFIHVSKYTTTQPRARQRERQRAQSCNEHLHEWNY